MDGNENEVVNIHLNSAALQNNGMVTPLYVIQIGLNMTEPRWKRYIRLYIQVHGAS